MKRNSLLSFTGALFLLCQVGPGPGVSVLEESVIGHWAVRMDGFYLKNFLNIGGSSTDHYFLTCHQYFAEDGFFREEWSGTLQTMTWPIVRAEDSIVFLIDTGRWIFKNGSIILEREKCYNPTLNSYYVPELCGCNEYGRKQVDTIKVVFFNERTWVRQELIDTVTMLTQEVRWWRMQ